MRLVAEAFPWSEQSTLAYTLDNHNSVVGMRGYALEQQASAVAVHIVPSHSDGTSLAVSACHGAAASCPSPVPQVYREHS